MRTSHCRIQPVVRAQGPEWAVHCDGAWLEQFGSRGATAAGADSGAYRMVLQVLDLDTAPVAALADAGGSEPRDAALALPQRPDAPGSKQREYPHSSGDRNTFPPVSHPEKRNRGGGRQRVAPTDLPRGAPGRNGAR